MLYTALKHIHVGAVIISFVLFFLRGVWMLRDSQQLRQRWVKIFPHVIDSVLLISALWLAVLIHQYPFVHAWLTAKVVGLILYIILGMLALRWGRTKRIRAIAWCSALLVFIGIVTVALNRHVVESAV